MWWPNVWSVSLWVLSTWWLCWFQRASVKWYFWTNSDEHIIIIIIIVWMCVFASFTGKTAHTDLNTILSSGSCKLANTNQQTQNLSSVSCLFEHHRMLCKDKTAASMQPPLTSTMLPSSSPQSHFHAIWAGVQPFTECEWWSSTPINYGSAPFISLPLSLLSKTWMQVHMAWFKSCVLLCVCECLCDDKVSPPCIDKVAVTTVSECCTQQCNIMQW